jgi:hypothetical protein
LLNRAGFTLTTVDTDDITINYPSMWELMADLRDMGESNAILGRRAQVSRDVLLSAEAIYKGGCVCSCLSLTLQSFMVTRMEPSPPLSRLSSS